MNRQQQLAIRALENLKGDDTYRAKMAFRGMTSAQMDQQYGESGKTRRQILAEYQELRVSFFICFAVSMRLMSNS